MQTVRVALVADVAGAWFVHAANRSLLDVAGRTIANADAVVRVVSARHCAGTVPRDDLRQAETIRSAARADAAALRTAVAQSSNALALLVGAPVDDALLPARIEAVTDSVSTAPAGLSSTILLRRPDVVQAEFGLKATYADIGAARAALFPRLSLTALVGVASPALRGLFDDDAFAWSAGAAATAPLFQGGAGRAGIAVSRARRDAAVAGYERAIQNAFRDVADALARRATIGDQLAAQGETVAAAQDGLDLANARYRAGVVPLLVSLDTQRTRYVARRGLVSGQLARTMNAVALYRALAGGVQP